jgi:adenosylcobinamide kinase/adenosylcobinamide-phosphate guanylyltransferase
VPVDVPTPGHDQSPHTPARHTQARRTLVLGGTRSGKSGYAEDLLPGEAPVRYLATARTDPTDTEWAARIATHRERRPACWSTEEDPDLAAALVAARAHELLMVDDLATWLTGVLDDAGAWDGGPDAAREVARRVDALVGAVDACAARLVLVSAEVGLGVVPATRSGRLFRDELGALNTRLARVCDAVVLLVAGIPLTLR